MNMYTHILSQLQFFDISQEGRLLIQAFMYFWQPDASKYKKHFSLEQHKQGSVKSISNMIMEKIQQIGTEKVVTIIYHTRSDSALVKTVQRVS